MTAPVRASGVPVHSLRFRLLAATLAAAAVASVLAGLLLANLFRDHVLRQFAQALTAQLDQLTARLEFDDQGRPVVDVPALSDPRWARPYSGLYWQVDGPAAQGPAARGVLRSRSLWDATLALPPDALADGVVHVHEVDGPRGARLLLVERTVRGEAAQGQAWRLGVAGDLGDTAMAIAGFNRVLVASLAVLLALLGVAAWAQVAIGLSPLRALHRALADLRAGAMPRLGGRFPAEVQPLVDDLNAVLDRNTDVVQRARTQAGNLAHAIKTPLAALSQAAADAQRDPARTDLLARLVAEQAEVARRHVDWHLARSRAAAAQGLPGARVPVQPVVDGLLRVLQRVHAERGLAVAIEGLDSGLAFAGEVQDLQEMLGNLLENAFQWARHEVRVSVERTDAAPGVGGTGDGGAAGGAETGRRPGPSSAPVPDARTPRLRLAIHDDGPGIAPDQRDRVMARGARLDESMPGSGLGLAIVAELAGLYGGAVQLGASDLGGLCVTLELPAA